MTNWLFTINTGQHLVNESQDPATTANLIADELLQAIDNGLPNALHNVIAIYELKNIIDDFRNVGGNKSAELDEAEADMCLSAMYDWGDAYHVWFTPVYQAQAANAKKAEKE